MTQIRNPFEYDAANNFSDNMIAKYYVDDFNYSRFIQSKRNIFLIGDRGSGKTMALLFNQWRLQNLIAQRKNTKLPLTIIGVYIPCNTPLTHRSEYQLLEDFPASVLSEHFLVLSIAHAIASTLSEIPDVLAGANDQTLRSEATFVFGSDIPNNGTFFDSIKQFLQRELLRTQRAINSKKLDVYYEGAFSFASVIVPLLNLARSMPQLKESHFLLMIDDAHTLNKYQMEVLNSWISYRDHSVFSFKVALAKVERLTLKTSSGGSILEGHDYTRIDLEEPYQNKDSDFYKLTRRLIAHRLKDINVDTTPEEFFPTSKAMKDSLEKSKEVVRAEAIEKYGEKASKSVTDHVYKYTRVHYFQNRPSKANRPPYSGFETLVFLSTGVVRNLLEPCYWMFDKALSSSIEKDLDSSPVKVLPAPVQTAIILARSKKLWDRLREGLDQNIEGCSGEDSLRAFNLLDALAVLFRKRLHHHKSEPSALTFTISGKHDSVMEDLNHLIDVLRRAQLIYTRSGPAKEEGRRETYYVPNRMLWPDRGLDPHGQHARVSLKAEVLWNAAKNGKAIPDEGETEGTQGRLWND